MTRNKHHSARRPQSGLTLIELSIVLIFLGLMIASYTYAYRNAHIQKEIAHTEAATMTIMDGLNKYRARMGRYPCPAPRESNPNDSYHGVERDCSNETVAIGSCGTGENSHCRAHSKGGHNIRIGAIPFKTIGIPESDAMDGYKNRFTYVVMESQAIPGQYDRNAGDLTIERYEYDDDDNLVKIDDYKTPEGRDFDMLIVSHGPDGAGSYTSQGRAYGRDCRTVTALNDGENCNNDGTFRIMPLDKGGNATYYDDMVAVNDWNWLYIWDQVHEEKSKIYNRNTGNLAVHIQDRKQQIPLNKLHVFGSNVGLNDATMKVEGKMLTNLVCDQGGKNCFRPELIGGTGVAGQKCAADQVLIRLANDKVHCRSFLSTVNHNCNGGGGAWSFVKSFNITTAGLVSGNCVNHVNSVRGHE